MEVTPFLRFNIILYLSRSIAKVLKGVVELKVTEPIRLTYVAFEIEILEGVVSQDHVYILASTPINLAPSGIMRQIKGKSSMKLFESFPDLENHYWDRHF